MSGHPCALVGALEAAAAGGPPVVAVELRPPAADLDSGAAMEAWIDLHQVLLRLSRDGRFVFLTDNAVASEEEENLGHLSANLPPEAERARVSPILTSKHTLEYCLLYAQRAWAAGIQALTVVGGDKHAGPPRCVPHAYLLRREIRAQVPGLALGGWANPHRPADEQAGFLTDAHATTDYFLTQIVSHHDAGGLEALNRTLERRGSPLLGLAGIFLYRSASPRTLDRLGQYFPVPREGIVGDFEAGLSAEVQCARSIRAALDAGAAGVYLCNLGYRGAARRLKAVFEELDRLAAPA